MKAKPQIHYCQRTHRFLKDGEPIMQEQARACWDDTKSADWSLKAFEVMSRAVLQSPNVGIKAFEAPPILIPKPSFKPSSMSLEEHDSFS